MSKTSTTHDARLSAGVPDAPDDAASAAGGVDNRESGSAAQLAGDDIGHKAKVG